MIQWALNNNWDVYLAGDGNPRLVTDNLELAQTVACNCRVILGESWVDDAAGVPYSLGDNKTSLSQLSEYIRIEAMKDSRVKTATLEQTEIKNRTFTGIISINGAINVRI